MSPRTKRMGAGIPVHDLRKEVEELKKEVKSVKENGVAPVHTIYPDGTYSNQNAVVVESGFASLKDCVKHFETVVMGDGSRWQVLEIEDWGLHLVKLPLKTQARLEDATVFGWDTLQELKGRKA